jgi:hypothetical protein
MWRTGVVAAHLLRAMCCCLLQLAKFVIAVDARALMLTLLCAKNAWWLLTCCMQCAVVCCSWPSPWMHWMLLH